MHQAIPYRKLLFYVPITLLFTIIISGCQGGAGLSSTSAPGSGSGSCQLYIVRKGDSLSNIASKYNTSAAQIQQDNQQYTPIPDANLIHPGQVIHICDHSNSNNTSNVNATPVATSPPNSQPICPIFSSYCVFGPPTLNVTFMNKVLADNGSPAAGKAQALYNYGKQYNIDPAYALAFFAAESSYGTTGEARTSHSIGNLRCIQNASCIDTSGNLCQSNNCYAAFPTWEQGFEAWYQLIRYGGYVDQGLMTVDQIIRKSAPSTDNNNDPQYINTVQNLVDTWHGKPSSAV